MICLLTEGADLAISANVFNAPRGFTPGGTDQVNTLNDDDELTGFGTNPTLNVTLVDDADTGEQTITPTLNGIETININDTDAQAPNLNLEDATGLVNVSLRGMEDLLTLRQIINMPGTAVNLKVDGAGNDIAGVVFTYDNDADQATDSNFPSEVNLELSDVIAVTTGVTVDSGATLNIESTGDVNRLVDLIVDDANTITIAGDENLTISALSASAGVLRAIDASAFEANLDVNLGANNIVEARVALSSGSDVDFTFTGGSGNDTIRVDNASLSAAPTGGDDANGHDVIDGGAGTNTLDFTVGATADLVQEDTTVSNIQTARLDVTGAFTADLDVSLVGGLDTVIARNDATAVATASFDLNEMTDAIAVQVQHASFDANSTNAAATNVELNFANASGKNDSATVEIIAGTNTAEEFNFTLDVDGADAKGRADLGAVENLSITDSDNEDNTVVLSSAAQQTGTLTLTGGRAGDDFVVDADIVAKLVEASEQASNVTVTLAGGNSDRDTGAQQVNFGAGDDVAVFTESALDENDGVEGGEGTDRVTALYTDGDDALELDLQLSNVEEFAVFYGDDADPDNLEINLQDNRNFSTLVLLGDVDAANIDGNGNVATGKVILEADTVSTIRYETIDGAAASFNGFELIGNDVDDVTVDIAVEAGAAHTADLLEVDNVVNMSIAASDDAEFTFNTGITDTDDELTTLIVTAEGTDGDLDLGTITAASLESITASVEGSLTMVVADTDGDLVVTVTDTATNETVDIDVSAVDEDVTVTTGKGVDTVTAGTGTSIISTGAGNDSIIVTADNADSRFTTGTGSDDIEFSVGGDNGRVTDFSATDTLTWAGTGIDNWQDEETNLANAEAALTGGGDVDAVFVTGNRTLYIDLNGDGLLTDSDFSVVLTGVTDLDYNAGEFTVA